MSSTHYQAINMSSALEASKARSRRSKWIVIGSIAALVVLAAIGTAVGVVVSKNNSKNSTSASTSAGSTSGSTSGGSSTTGGTTKGETSDPNSPSNFKKDPNLRQAFYGMAYTPEGALLEFNCTNTLESTIKDIQILSQLTKRVRLYASDCNQTAQVLEAIKQTKVDMEVFLGNYVTPDDNAAYLRQRDSIKAAIETYGTDHIAGVTVGNEFMLNWVTEHNTQDPNSDIGKQGSAILLATIQDTKSMLEGMGLKKHIPVGNSDAGSYFSTEILQNVEYGLSNVHAWFAQTTAEGAAKWVFDFFQETNVAPAALLSNKPHMYIAETGWPTKSSDAAHQSNGAADASEANLQIFLDTFICQANDAGVGYFFFELFDEEWKDKKFGGVEGWWGLFNKDRTLKNIKIPNCVAP